jgi:hypothetical protein
VPANVVYMNTTAADIMAAFSDETLTGVHYRNGRTVRDSSGNLRELTEAEREFIAATRAEMKRRGLL